MIGMPNQGKKRSPRKNSAFFLRILRLMAFSQSLFREDVTWLLLPDEEPDRKIHNGRFPQKSRYPLNAE